jgi:hypothetical protein
MKKLELRVDGVNLGFAIQTISNAILMGKTIKLVISEWREKRSLSQNALMWMWLTEICEQIHKRIGEDHEPEVLHEYFKKKFCPQKTVMLGRKELTFSSTKRLDIGEMTHYLIQIENWAIENGFRLTIPEDCEYRRYIEEQNR